MWEMQVSSQAPTVGAGAYKPATHMDVGNAGFAGAYKPAMHGMNLSLVQKYII
ncbi:MAG: hypothetical protein ACI9LO_002080 [Planctomycetota bacterium]|jgi:hypothetical protein